MTGDRRADSRPRSIESYHELVAWIADQPPQLGASRLILVDGPSGAGKTQFAGRLAAAYDRACDNKAGDTGSAVVVHTDDLLDGWDDQLTFWTRLHEWVLAPLRAGRAGAYRRYDWQARRFGDEWQPVPAVPLVIVEGMSTARAEAREFANLTVFVDVPADLRRRRAVDRDGAGVVTYLEKWWTVEERHFAADATAHNADLVVDGAPCMSHDPEREYVRFERWTPEAT